MQITQKSPIDSQKFLLNQAIIDPKTDRIHRNPNPNQQIQTQSKQHLLSFMNSPSYLLVLPRRPSARRRPEKISTRAAQVDPPKLMPPLHHHRHPFSCNSRKKRNQSNNNIKKNQKSTTDLLFPLPIFTSYKKKKKPMQVQGLMEDRSSIGMLDSDSTIFLQCV